MGLVDAVVAFISGRRDQDHSGDVQYGTADGCPCLDGLEYREDGTFVNPFSYAGGDASCQEDAVIVLGIVRPVIFVRGVHLWIHEHHPKWRVLDGRDEKGIRSILSGDHRFLALAVQKPDGTRTELFFDDTVACASALGGQHVVAAAGSHASYEEIVQKLAVEGDLAMNYSRLREAFKESECYRPYDGKLSKYIERVEEATSCAEWTSVLAHAEGFLELCQASPFPHMTAALAHGHLGNTSRESFHRSVADGLLVAMLSTADGRSKGSALEVLFVFEEYQLLSMWQLVPIKQAIVRVGKKAFDVVTVRNERVGEERDVYFDVTTMMAKMHEQSKHVSES